jgi:hypothetical protein
MEMRKQFLNPVVVDGMVRKIDSRDRHLNLGAVDEVVQNVTELCTKCNLRK